MDKILEKLHSAQAMAKFHGAITIVWVLMLPVSMLTPLKDSVPYLVGLSVWALIGSHWAAYQGARSELQRK